MKKIEQVEVTDETGYHILLGETVLVMCANYFYHGDLIGVNEDTIVIKNPSIVYETGSWNDKQYEDKQSMCVDEWHIKKDAIESLGKSNVN